MSQGVVVENMISMVSLFKSSNTACKCSNLADSSNTYYLIEFGFIIVTSVTTMCLKVL